MDEEIGRRMVAYRKLLDTIMLNSDLVDVWSWSMDQDLDLSARQVELDFKGLLPPIEYIFALSFDTAHEGFHLVLSNIEKIHKKIRKINLANECVFNNCEALTKLSDSLSSNLLFHRWFRWRLEELQQIDAP